MSDVCDVSTQSSTCHAATRCHPTHTPVMWTLQGYVCINRGRKERRSVTMCTHAGTTHSEHMQCEERRGGRGGGRLASDTPDLGNETSPLGVGGWVGFLPFTQTRQIFPLGMVSLSINDISTFGVCLGRLQLPQNSSGEQCLVAFVFSLPSSHLCKYGVMSP